MAKLKGFYKRTWYQNRVLFHEVGEFLKALHLAGVRTMLLKGPALTLVHYKDYGIRPMTDFDVLVPPEQASTALETLEDLDWSPKSTQRAPHSWAFENAAGRELDLHWNLLVERSHPDADQDLWRLAIPTTLEGVPTLALDPEDQLLHVCVHGVAWNAVPPLRWVADATAILRTAEIDWDELVDRARKRRVLPPLTSALEYLQRTLGAPIPAATLRLMSSIPATRAERLYYRARTCPEELRGPFLTLWIYFWEYLGSVEGSGIASKLFGFPRYLQFVWNLEHLWHVPYYVVIGAAKRTWHLLARTSGAS